MKRLAELNNSPRPVFRSGALLRIALSASFLVLAGCQSSGSGGATSTPKSGGILSKVSETTQHGYVVTPEALEQIPVGSSKDQVLIALGSPSTTANYGNDVFYYISQTRYRAVAFMPDKVIDQRIVAVYFDKKNQVERVANYGLKDGKVFDFVKGTTPTAGADENFVQQVLSGVIGIRGKM
jgi:outer membrane protein assembly factor BamE (lipoprotein component of BamABCDE complex)